VCLRASLLFNDCSRCKFKVVALDEGRGRAAQLFLLRDLKDTSWLNFEVDLPVWTSHVEFVATSGRTSGGGVALDDIMVDGGRCEGSSRMNFGEEDFCFYTQDEADDFDWILSTDTEDGGSNPQSR
ncbi:uncharacterized protein LOC106012306, partial [Aplysia californica]|uniref:Uncharacterized protein LOC106012306 n=1 Tax=Aplysia californica TaxID=6500 RepID=A0ABM1A3Y2_APLCA